MRNATPDRARRCRETHPDRWMGRQIHDDETGNRSEEGESGERRRTPSGARSGSNMLEPIVHRVTETERRDESPMQVARKTKPMEMGWKRGGGGVHKLGPKLEGPDRLRERSMRGRGEG